MIRSQSPEERAETCSRPPAGALPERPAAPSLSDPAAQELLAEVRHLVQACIQCGTCTGSCPNAFAMDITPRRLWRFVLLDDIQAVFSSRTFSLCSNCYTCSLRCPRGLRLTEAMNLLKQLAVIVNAAGHRQAGAFFNRFISNIRRHGRVNELELMALYFAKRKNPYLPFRFAGLGLRLIIKGKLPLWHRAKHATNLEALFQQTLAEKEGK